jgi:hypothetical protein
LAHPESRHKRRRARRVLTSALVSAAAGVAAAAAVAVSPRAVHAQDTLAARPQIPVVTVVRPPISPAKAFFASALVPGLGQSSLKRGTGIIFITFEAVAITMYAKSKKDLRLAERFARDSTPLSYQLDPSTGLPARDPESGDPIVSAWSSGRFGPELIRARKTHVEDWAAALIFNHVFAGIDAFVAAHLWSLPAQVEMRASPNHFTVRAQIPW